MGAYSVPQRPLSWFKGALRGRSEMEWEGRDGLVEGKEGLGEGQKGAYR